MNLACQCKDAQRVCQALAAPHQALKRNTGKLDSKMDASCLTEKIFRIDRRNIYARGKTGMVRQLPPLAKVRRLYGLPSLILERLCLHYHKFGRKVASSNVEYRVFPCVRKSTGHYAALHRKAVADSTTALVSLNHGGRCGKIHRFYAETCCLPLHCHDIGPTVKVRPFHCGSCAGAAACRNTILMAGRTSMVAARNSLGALTQRSWQGVTDASQPREIMDREFRTCVSPTASNSCARWRNTGFHAVL